MKNKFLIVGIIIIVAVAVSAYLIYTIPEAEENYNEPYWPQPPELVFPDTNDVDNIILNYDYLYKIPEENKTKIIINKNDENFERLYNLLKEGITNDRVEIFQRALRTAVIINKIDGSNLTLLDYRGEIWIDKVGNIGAYKPNSKFSEFLEEANKTGVKQ